MDHTGSEEGKQPAEESGTPSQFSAGKDRASCARSGQEEESESARRAFDLLERFGDELEEILLSLERTRSSAASAENSPQAPRTFSPSSIHFDPSPISARIDPYALPPFESPGATARPAPRRLLEYLFLILVAAISTQTDLRPRLIIAAEVVAFLIVASIELAIEHDKRRYRQLPASAPTFASPPAPETETTSKPLSVTFDQVEPLVWRTERRDDDADTNWPLATIEPPSEPDEAEGVEEAQEGVTEISTAMHAEGGVGATPVPAPEVRSEAASESAAEIPAAEPEPEAQPENAGEIPTSEVEPEHHRRFGLFRHEASESVGEAEPDAEPEPEPEAEAETEPENTAEIPASEVELKRHGHFHLFGREEKALEAEVGLEAEAGLESALEILATEPESEVEHHRRFGLFRHEASESVGEAEPDAEPEPEPEAEAETEPENTAEIPASEVELKRHGHFHLFGREEKALEAEVGLEAEAGLESAPEILAAEPEPEAEAEAETGLEAEAELESAPEILAAEPEPEAEAETGLEAEAGLESAPEILAKKPESEPEHHRRFGLFRHEASESVGEAEPDAEPEPEPEAETELEAEAGLESAPEILAKEPESEPEHHRRFGLFRHEASESVGEAEPDAEPEPEAEAETEPEAEAELESAPEILAAEPEPEPEAEVEAETELEAEAELESAPEILATEPESEVEHHRRFGLFRHEASESVGETEPEPEAEAEAETELEAEAELESAPEILAKEPESEVEHHRRFGLFRHEASEPVGETEPDAEPEPEPEAEAEAETEPENTAEIPASEVAPKRYGHFHLFGREEKALEAEVGLEAEAGLESAPEILATEPESEVEHHRRLGLFRHEASEPVGETEPAAEPEPEPEAEAEAETELEIKPRHSDRMHRFRRAAAEAPNGEGGPLEDTFWQRSVEGPGSSAGTGDTTIEIDLPPEISIDEIERTLEKVGGREPDLRRRRWLRGASAEKDATEQSANDETASVESEMRLAAELERRRCEREYLRSLRTPR